MEWSEQSDAGLPVQAGRSSMAVTRVHFTYLNLALTVRWQSLNAPGPGSFQGLLE